MPNDLQATVTRQLFAALATTLAAAAWVRARWEDFLLLLPPSRKGR